MIAHYYVFTTDNPKTIARQLHERGTITVRGRYNKTHEEPTDESTRIHVGINSYSVTEFIDKYL